MEFQHILEIAREFNAESIKVFNFSAQGRGYDNRHYLKLSTKEQKETTKMIKKVLDKKNVQIDFGGEISGLNTQCSVGQKIVITCDGDVVPCLGLRANKAFIVGNIRNESLSDLLAKLEKIRSDTCLCSTAKTTDLSSTTE
jgi:MoaA/NifB/PqqE/SkfB family radical SAM enzyme